MLVTDNDGLLGVLHRMLAPLGVAVVWSSIAFASDVCAAVAPAGVVFEMPAQFASGIRGLSALRYALPDTPMLVLSEHPVPAHLTRELAPLVKPFTVASLRNAIEVLLP